MARASVLTREQLGADARQEWRTRAACAGRPDLIRGGPGEDQRISLCLDHCPVLAECRTWVLSLPPCADPGDIAGGLTASQRARIRGTDDIDLEVT